MKKKLGIILVSVLAVFCITGCEKEYSNIKELSYSQLEEKVNNKETFILEVMKTGCSACETYTPVFNDVLREHKVKAYQINLAKLSKEEANKLDEIANVSATPTTVFIIDG